MKKKSILSICFIAISLFSFAQDNERSRFGYRVGFGFGNATLENSQIGVLDANVFSMRFNADYRLSNMYLAKIISGVELLDVNSGYFDGRDQSKVKYGYLQIPLKLMYEVKLDKSNRLSLISGAGAYANFLFYSHVTTIIDNEDTKQRGVNFGYTFFFGLEYNLNEVTSIGIYVDAMSELDAIKKNGYELQQTQIALFHVGFSSSF